LEGLHLSEPGRTDVGAEGVELSFEVLQGWGQWRPRGRLVVAPRVATIIAIAARGLLCLLAVLGHVAVFLTIEAQQLPFVVESWLAA
jgi:hypothetical protein